MNAVVDNKVVITGFNGLYDRGAEDACPLDHLYVCDNASFPGPNQIKTRDGVVSVQTTPEPVIAFFQAELSTRTFLLTLSSTGVLRDGSKVLATWSGATGFSAINLYNRVYLCPTYKWHPLSGEKVYYYDGTNFAPAAGSPPTTAPSATQLLPGIVEKGKHRIAVLFQTRTGFQTAYGPYVEVDAPGDKDIELTNVPIGGPEVVARVIVATKADELEFFFVPNGRIENNTDTSINIDFLDTDLTVSAGYLAEVCSTIPAGVALRFYRGRLIVVGTKEVWASYVGDPETFTSAGDTTITLPIDGSTVALTTAWELRDVLYLGTTFGIYSVQDNGDNPDTWPVLNVDPSQECYDRGVSSPLSALPSRGTFDMVLVATRAGLVMFDGVFRYPPLSWKIDNLWHFIRALPDQFCYVTVSVDTQQRCAYISVLLEDDQGTTPNTILMMDYKEGLSPDKVKWSVWRLPKKPTCSAMANPSGGNYLLHFGSTEDSAIYAVQWGVNNDLGSPIPFNFTTASIPIKQGFVSVYTGLRFRMSGNSNVWLTVAGEDSTNPTDVSGFTLTETPGADLFRMINFTSETLKVKIYPDPGATDPWCHIRRIEVFGIPRWMMRPVVKS